MFSLNCLSNYTNSFIIDDCEFEGYEVIEDTDESGKLRYRYQRINLTKNTEIIRDKDQYRNTVYQTHEVVDLGSFDKWLRDVLRLNYRRFISSHAEGASLTNAMRKSRVFYNLTVVAWLVRTSLSFKDYNLDYSATESWFDIRGKMISNYYRTLFANPFVFRQTGKSEITKSLSEAVSEWFSKKEESLMGGYPTVNTSDIIGFDLSEVYPKEITITPIDTLRDKFRRNMISGAKTYTSSPFIGDQDAEILERFGKAVYQPELVVTKDYNGDVTAKPSKVFYYTEEDLNEMPEEVRSKFVLVKLPKDLQENTDER